MIDTLALPAFLAPEPLAALLDALRHAPGEAAPVYGRGAGGSVDLRTRATTRLAPADAVRRATHEALRGARGALETHFGLALQECEPPQFLRYEPGGFFVAHQDGNTPLLHDDTRFRRISVVLFLNPASEAPAAGAYGGGEFVLHGPLRGPVLRESMQPVPGTLLAFRAETTHEVLPVAHGERYTVVSWWR
jgi:SM-20-related protein